MLNHRAAILSQTRYRQHQSIRANFEMIVEPLRDILGRNSPSLTLGSYPRKRELTNLIRRGMPGGLNLLED